MKKISVLLFATIFGLTAMAQLNPYAYGLSSSWNPTTQMLTVDFKLNAKANKIEIFAVDRSNSNKTYKIHEITSPGDMLDYSIPPVFCIPTNYRTKSQQITEFAK